MQIGLSLSITAPRALVEGLLRPVLSNAPTLDTSGFQGADATISTDDTWTIDGAAATIDSRSYRARVNGLTVIPDQSSPILSIPFQYVGHLLEFEMRVVSGGTTSSWTAVDEVRVKGVESVTGETNEIHVTYYGTAMPSGDDNSILVEIS